MKSYVITGASRGIGEYLYGQLIGLGQTWGTYSSTVNSKYESLSRVDITNEGAVQQWIHNIIATNPQEIVLINCAGVNHNGFAHKTSLPAWANVIDTNLIGTFNVISKMLPYMRERNWGRIINLSSVVAEKGVAGTSAYAASKSALWGMSRAIAVENASKGITINNINLGYFDIGMIDQVPEQLREEIKKQIPAKRFGERQEILNTVNYIVDTPYLNGTSIDLSGGLV